MARVWVWVVFLWGFGLVLLYVVGGINVASEWGCVQGVWVQCRCWSLGMGGKGAKRGLLGLQKLQLKTVLITEGHVAKCELLEARLGEAGDRPRLPGLYDVNIFKRHISHMRCSAAVYGGFAGIC